LIETLIAGVYSHPGQKAFNEDVYSVISWRTSPTSHSVLEESEVPKHNDKTNSINHEDKENLDNNSNEKSEESPPKKQKVNELLSLKQIEFFSHYAFFAVYDGHGGLQAADFVNNNLHKNIIRSTHFPKDPEAAIFAAFLQTEKEFAKYAKEKNIDGGVGTTVTFALIIGNTLYVANVGDSESVLCCNGKPVVLTVAHTLDDPSEIERIQKIGGKIVPTTPKSRLGHPVWNSRLINIGVTRSIGDLYFKDPEFIQNNQSGLIAEPYTVKKSITKEDDFLLIASDGFWDEVSKQEAVEHVLANGFKDCDSICRELVEISRLRKSRDNITVLLIKFKPLNKQQNTSK